MTIESAVTIKVEPTAIGESKDQALRSNYTSDNASLFFFSDTDDGVQASAGDTNRNSPRSHRAIKKESASFSSSTRIKMEDEVVKAEVDKSDIFSAIDWPMEDKSESARSDRSSGLYDIEDTKCGIKDECEDSKYVPENA